MAAWLYDHASIRLTAEEQQLAVDAGAKRLALNRLKDPDDKNWWSQTGQPTRPPEESRDSVGAEIAWGRLTRLPIPKLVLEEWVGSIEYTLPDGRLLDVKSTKNGAARLLLRWWVAERPPHPQLYVVLVSHFPVYRFMGWATHKQLTHRSNLTTMNGYATRTCYCLGWHCQHHALELPWWKESPQ